MTTYIIKAPSIEAAQPEIEAIWDKAEAEGFLFATVIRKGSQEVTVKVFDDVEDAE